MRRVSQDGSGLAGIAIDEDECGTLDAVVPLPIDRKGDIGLFDMGGFGLPIACHACSQPIRRIQQPRIPGPEGLSPLVPVGIMRERELQCSSRNSNVSRAALETTEEVRQHVRLRKVPPC